MLGYSALETGLRLLAITGLTLVFAPIGGVLSAVIPIRAILGIGLGFIAAGIFLMTSITPDSSWTVLAPGLILAGTGLGISAPAISNASVGIVPPWKTGVASGLNYTWRQLGLAVGIAVLGAIFQHQVRAEVDAGLANSPAAKQSSSIAEAIAAGGTPGVLDRTPPGSRPGIQRVAEISFASGLKSMFLVAGLVAAAGGIAGVALSRQRDLIAEGAGERHHEVTEYRTPKGTGPHALVPGPDGAMWFTGIGGRVGRLDTSTGKVTFLEGVSARSEPHALVWARDGNLYWAEQRSGRVGRYDPRSKSVTESAYSEDALSGTAPRDPGSAVTDDTRGTGHRPGARPGGEAPLGDHLLRWLAAALRPRQRQGDHRDLRDRAARGDARDRQGSPRADVGHRARTRGAVAHRPVTASRVVQEYAAN